MTDAALNLSPVFSEMLKILSNCYQASFVGFCQGVG
jgi:hypothetical protein